VAHKACPNVFFDEMKRDAGELEDARHLGEGDGAEYWAAFFMDKLMHKF
jgi:hypothetical protein